MRESVKPLCCPILPTLAPIVWGSKSKGTLEPHRVASVLVLTSYERVLQVGTGTVAGRKIDNGGNGRAGARAAAQGASPGRGELRRAHARALCHPRPALPDQAGWACR